MNCTGQAARRSDADVKSAKVPPTPYVYSIPPRPGVSDSVTVSGVERDSISALGLGLGLACPFLI